MFWMESTSQVILWSVLVPYVGHLLYTWLSLIKFDIYRYRVYDALCIGNSSIFWLICSADSDCGNTYNKS